jgi:CubicO group peptidase (beta-lactamase class C family)
VFKSRLVLVVGGVVLAGLAGAYAFVAHSVASGPAGAGVALGAQIGCADVFLMKRAPDEALRDDIHALAPAAKVIQLKADLKRQSVTASVPLLLYRTAVYRPGVGCTLLNGRAPLAPAVAAAPVQSAPLPRAPAVAAVDAAVEQVFRETNAGGYPDTRAIVVLKDGKLLAERYAPGFSADTPFLGWSMSKSVTSALVGVLVRDGKLQLDAPAPVPEWRAPGDPRGRVTLRQLLNMSSGLKFVEDYVAGSDSTAMLFHQADMAAYAAGQPLQHPPGKLWSYSSGTANIVARIVKDAVGGTDEALNRFARDQLFEPAGMASLVLEPDGSGTPVGSSYGYATAQDWARFGQLYLDRGVANGRRVLPESWIDFTKTPAPAAPTPLYGAMFWLNQGPASGPGARSYPHCPNDMYMADGHNGQSVAIVPSRGVVIVRLGWTPEGRHFDIDRYFSAILAAVPGGEPSPDTQARA